MCTMSRDEIVDKIIDELRWLKDSNFNQEPYKDRFFSLFALAFNTGLLDRSAGDDYLGTHQLTEIILTKAQELVDSSRYNTNWSKFYTSWDEWTYAWVRASACYRA
jgi:hypothetical protein